MSERIRSVRVRIDIDTNKQTHSLDEIVELDEVEATVRMFLEGLR